MTSNQPLSSFDVDELIRAIIRERVKAKLVVAVSTSAGAALVALYRKAHTS
jgi:histone H3/H4